MGWLDEKLFLAILRPRLLGPVAGANLTDASVSLAADADAPLTWRRLPASTLSGNRVLTLSTTGAQKGQQILLTRDDAEAFTYTIANGGVGGGNLLVMPVSKIGHIRSQFDGTNWLQIGRAS